MLDQLRQTLRALERPALLEDGAAALPLGIPEVDAALGGGLSCGALHEIAALSEAHLPTATGFVAGIARAACAPSPRLRGEGRGEGPVSLRSSEAPHPDRFAIRPLPVRTGRGERALVWAAEDLGLAESGALYGPGFDGCGIPPERLLTVSVAHRRDLLWAMEEALHCRGVSVVVGEMREGALDGVAVRRLSLAAADSGALALLLRAAPPEDASTAATRWIVGAAPSRSEEAHFTARLVRNRRGPLGSWILSWSDDDDFAAHAQPLAAPAADRPHRAVA